MTIRTRIDNFQGSDSEYIIYLERKVTQLTRPHSPPSSPQADVGDKLRFVPFEPGTLATCGKTTPNRWQNEMDKMLGSFPGDGDWSSKRESTGLSTESKLLLAFDIITGISMPSVKPTTVGSNLLAPAELDTAFRLVGGYAKSVAAMNTEKVFTTQIVNFCNVIFVSQCCVLLHQGVEASRVDDLMKICISKSDPKNLGVLRRGAIWVNRMIRVLAGDGLGQRASEAFVLCGETVAQYGRFADAGENGFSYFRKSVQARGFNESNAHTFLPFWIPFFIKTILGDVYSLFDICDALGYDETSKMGGYSEWLESYRSRKVLLPNAVLAGGYRNHQEAEDSLPNPAPKRRRKSTRPIPKRKRQLAGPGLKRKSKSFEPADRRQLQGSSRADPLRCLDPDPDPGDVSHSDSRVPHEDHAMHALLIAVDHAVSCEQDQQLGGVTGVSGSLDWDGLDSRGQVESNSLQQLCVVSNTNTSAFGNAFMPACQIKDNNESANAGNNQPFFDYAKAYDLNTLAFDYNNAYDLNTIAFDYNNAYDLNTIAFDYNNAYDLNTFSFENNNGNDLTTFVAFNCTAAYTPSSLSADTACNLPPSANLPTLPEVTSTDLEPGVVPRSL